MRKLLCDYRNWLPDKRQRLKYYGAACSGLFVCGVLFYRDLAIALLCMTAAPLGEKLWRRYLQKKRKEKLLEGFRDMLYTISSAVAAGRQLPFAVEEAAAALASSWGEDSDICKEAVHMASVYREAHGDPDGLWLDFARRSGIVEIRRFADSCRICRRNGGNMEEVCFKTASVLLERLAFQDDIKALSAEKRLEILILSAMPAGALVLLNLTSYEYIQVLYTTAAGRLLMTICLGLIAAALWLSKKYLEVEL